MSTANSPHRGEAASTPLPWRGSAKKAVTLRFSQLHVGTRSYMSGLAVTCRDSQLHVGTRSYMSGLAVECAALEFADTTWREAFTRRLGTCN
jgi:hypothetical protein